MNLTWVRVAVLIVACCGAGTVAFGADGYWTNSFGGNWSLSGNWSGGTVADGAGNTAWFTNDVGGNRPITNDATRTIGKMEFGDLGYETYTRSLVGDSVLTLSAGGTAEIRWTTPVEIFAPLAGSDDVLFIGRSTAYPPGSSSALKMRGTNTYTGATILRRGRLTTAGNVTPSANGPLGNATSAVQVGDAGTLSSEHLQFLIETANANFARLVVVNNKGNTVAIGNLATAGDTMTMSGGITLNRDVLLVSRANMAVTGNITGAGGIKVSSTDNTGTIILQGNNDFLGDVVISRRVLVASHANALGAATTAVQLGDADTGANDVGLQITNGITLSREINLASSGTGAATIGLNSAGSGTYAGPITINRTLNVVPKSGGALRITAPISGSGGLRSFGNSDGYVYLLCPTNSFAGSMDVGAGFVVVSNEVRKNQNGPLGNSESAIVITAPAGSVPTLYVDADGVVDRNIMVTGATASALIGTRSATQLLFASSLTVSNPVTTISPVNAANLIEWAGPFFGTGIVQKSGSGVLVISGTNSAFAGGFTLGGGTLRLNSPSPLGDGSQRFKFGATGTRLENSFGPYTFLNSVEINRDPRYYGAHDIVFMGGKTINGALGNTPFTVDQTNALMAFRGNLVSYDQGTLTKLGAGFLEWGGTNLTANFTNGIVVNAGVFRAYEGVGISTQNNIHFVGGIWESTGTCTRALGTRAGAGQISWGPGAMGGFSAFGAPFIINIGGVAANLYWNSNSFVQVSGALVFGSVRADNAVIFKNRIDVAGATRSIAVYDNTNSIADKAVLEGGIELGAQGITKSGSGVLVLGGTNSGTGTITVNAGTLLVDGEVVASATPMACKSNTWLGGRGTIKRSVTLEPGFAGFDWADAPGTLTIQTNMTLPQGFTYNFRRLGGQDPLIYVTGTLTVSNAVTINVYNSTQPELTLFTVGALAGAQNLTNWVVTGSLVPYTIKVQGTSIIAGSQPRGTIISVR